jgi:hypothetical protein
MILSECSARTSSPKTDANPNDDGPVESLMLAAVQPPHRLRRESRVAAARAILILSLGRYGTYRSSERARAATRIAYRAYAPTHSS